MTSTKFLMPCTLKERIDQLIETNAGRAVHNQFAVFVLGLKCCALDKIVRNVNYAIGFLEGVIN